MSRVLIHSCCAPCTVAPYTLLTSDNRYQVTCYWFNDNIHPYQEYKKRWVSFQEWTKINSVPIIIEPDYNPEDFLRRVAARPEDRCFFCYYFRLLRTAETAKKKGFDSFTTSLFYSVHQKHSLIKQIAEEIADRVGIPLFYRDFRDLWQEGINLSKELDMYRQPYCGCIYSEKERYLKKRKNQ